MNRKFSPAKELKERLLTAAGVVCIFGAVGFAYRSANTSLLQTLVAPKFWSQILDAKFRQSPASENKFAWSKSEPEPAVRTESHTLCEDLALLFENSAFAKSIGWKAPRSEGFQLVEDQSLTEGDDLAGESSNLQGSLARFGLSRARTDFSRGLNFAEVARINENEVGISEYLPKTLTPSQDVGGITSQVLNHGLSQFFNGEMMQKTSLGKAAKTVERNMKTDVAIGGKEPDSIQHKFQFQVNAPQAQAMMQYNGFTQATVRFNMIAQSSEIELAEPISKSATMVYSHNNGPVERKDTLSIRLPW